MASQVITRPGPNPTPLDLELGALEELTPQSAFAHYDGTVAAGSFLPAFTYYTQDGRVFMRALGQVVAAGESADVSYFPGLTAVQESGGGGGGITLIDSPDSSISVTNPSGPTVDLQVAAPGIRYGVINSGTQLTIQETGSGIGFTSNTSFGVTVGAASFGMTQFNGHIDVTTTTQLTLNGGATSFLQGTAIFIQASGAGGGAGTHFSGAIGFFGKVPVNRQATPVTLADVITLLQAYGLCP